MSIKERYAYFQVRDQLLIVLARGTVLIGPYSTSTDTGLKALYIAYKAKEAVKHRLVRFYIDSKELGKGLSRNGTLKTVYKSTIKLRGLNYKAHKFFLLDRCPKYINIERDKLPIKEEIVNFKGGSNAWLEGRCQKRRLKRTGVGQKDSEPPPPRL